MNRPLACPHEPRLIPFPFTSFADPSTLTPLDSYRFKNRGGPGSPPQSLSRFGTAPSRAWHAGCARGNQSFLEFLFQQQRPQFAGREAAPMANGPRERPRGLVPGGEGNLLDGHGRIRFQKFSISAIKTRSRNLRKETPVAARINSSIARGLERSSREQWSRELQGHSRSAPDICLRRT